MTTLGDLLTALKRIILDIQGGPERVGEALLEARAALAAFDPTRYLDLDDPATVGRLAEALHESATRYHSFEEGLHSRETCDAPTWHLNRAVKVRAALRERTEP